ncbi:hypothetical protein SOVF_007150 [Spinacia oleracea]|nr:hypothetical protein SOVF_007150 [Spinacia oleracea]
MHLASFHNGHCYIPEIIKLWSMPYGLRLMEILFSMAREYASVPSMDLTKRFNIN